MVNSNLPIVKLEQVLIDTLEAYKIEILEDENPRRRMEFYVEQVITGGVKLSGNTKQKLRQRSKKWLKGEVEKLAIRTD